MQVRFGPFALDVATRELRRDGDLVHVSPKAFDLLSLLLDKRPNAVSKSDIHAALWPDTFVSDGTIAVLMAEIRRALGDSARAPLYLRTVSRFGYAFFGPALLESAPKTGPAACWLLRGAERIRLRQGANVLGRDLDADIVIDAVGISRRHAVIEVGDAFVRLRDLASKNGTFVDGTRVTMPVCLEDNAEVRFGAVSVQFRRPPPASTATQTLSNPHDDRGSS
jgi:DNA-binding winged helix-turn-helix (wHTH) protein